MRSLQAAVNPGVALPPHIARRQAAEQRMLRKSSEVAAKALGVDPEASPEIDDAPAEEQVEEVVLPQVEEEAAPPPAPVAPAAPQRQLRTQKLVIEHPLFSLTLDIYDLDIKEHFISFSLDYNAATLPEFKDVCDLELKHQGKIYPVTYVGGSFTFPQHRLRAFAFVRRKPEEEAKA